MAIEVTNKIEKRSIILNIAIYLLLAVIITLAAGYFVMMKLEADASAKIGEINRQLAKTEEQMVKEKQTLEAKEKIDIFSGLLTSHQMASKLFSFLEKDTHPRVWFSNFDFDSAKKIVKVSGQAESFYVVGQQVLALKGEESLKEVKLSDVAISKEKGVDFSLSLSFNPQIFSNE